MRFLGLLAPLVAAPALAQWTPDFRVTNDPASSRAQVDGGRNVTASGDIVAIVWSDDRDGNDEIWFRERLLGTWNPAVRLTNDPGSSTHPAIGRFPNEMRVVWEDDRTGHPEIWMKRKVLGIWRPDSCLTCDAFDSARPGIDHAGQHVVWEETKDGNREIYYRRRPPSGPWGPEFRVSNDPAQSSHPSVASPHAINHPADQVLVVWQDDRHGNWEIYSRYENFSGWGPEVRVTADSASSRFPSARVEMNTCSDAISPENEVAWQDDRDGNEEIYLAYGVLGAWFTETRVTSTATPSRHPSLSTAMHVVDTIFGCCTFCPQAALAWDERDSGGASGSIRYLDPFAGPVAVVTDAGADPLHPSVAVDHQFTSFNGTRRVEIVWSDERDGNAEIYESNELSVSDVTNAPETPLGSQHLRLGPGTPNPFAASTSFWLTLDHESPLQIRVVDAAGRVVKRIFRGSRTAGVQRFAWDGTTEEGRPAPAGTYFVTVRSLGEVRTAKLVRVR